MLGILVFHDQAASRTGGMPMAPYGTAAFFLLNQTKQNRTMNTIIISVIITIGTAAAAYYLGKANGWQECCKETKNCINLPSPVNTLSRTTPIPHHYLTRYVPLNMELWRQVNDEVKKLEDDGFTVDECDTDNGFITMTKPVYKDKEGDTYFSPTPAARGGSSSIIPIPIPEP